MLCFALEQDRGYASEAQPDAKRLTMNTRVPTELLKPGKDTRIAELPVLREGVYHAGEESAEYVLLRPSADQWVVIAVVSARPGASRSFIVTHGTSETEAFRWLGQRMHPSGPPAALDAFSTDWAMRAPER
jgi:hypothetical protein